jgi:replication factor C small subunit
MSSKTLAELLWVEKYRPKSLSEMVNQEDVVKRLQQFIKERNMPHLLFAGPPGTGKTTAAHALAHDFYGPDYRMYMLELNASVSPNTPILVRIYDDIRLLTFADLDRIYFSEGRNVVTIGGSEYVIPQDLNTLSVGTDGRVRWARVSYLVRHRTTHILKVLIQDGSVIELTGNHSIITLDDFGFLKEKKASSLRPGDYLISIKPEVWSNYVALDSRYKDYVNLIYDDDLIPTNNNATIPLRPIVNLLKPIERSIKVDWRSLIRSDFEGYVGRDVILELIDSIDVKGIEGSKKLFYNQLRWLASPDLQVLRVEGVEVLSNECYVYDISIPGHEMFFAGITPILLHNSDERGIDVIRGKVKEFSRSKLPANIPFKIVLLDEADNMTADAQQALRRLMEMYVEVTRFILIANYPSKIIEPIQSRCAVFRFVPIKKEDVVSRLRWICGNEGVKCDVEALEVIYDISEGDMRKAINILQASASLGEVTVSNVYKVVGLAHPREVREMIQLALDGKFLEARDKLRDLMITYGLSGVDILRQMHREVFSSELKIPEALRVEIADYLGEIQFRLVEGADEEIQLSTLLAKLVLLGKAAKVVKPSK